MKKQVIEKKKMVTFGRKGKPYYAGKKELFHEYTNNDGYHVRVYLEKHDDGRQSAHYYNQTLGNVWVASKYWSDPNKKITKRDIRVIRKPKD